MEFAAVPASNYSLSDLVSVLNRGFDGYFIPIHFTNDLFSNMLRKDGIDLADSRVLLADNRACGIALIACRPSLGTSRVAAMGIAREARGKGAGSWFMKTLVDDACDRGEREMVLEVIEQNEPAIKLYRKYGFTPVRRLVGYIRKDKGVEADEENELQEIDLHDMSQRIAQHGLPELPWQLSGESILQMNPPPHAFRTGPAYSVISNPEAEHVVIWSVLVEPDRRGNGLGTKLLKRVMAQYPGKTWHVPALFPEEMGKVFERADFEKEQLSQWQMKLTL
jgi:ribosomal protein S18 acetylase RimI-like enzyme